MRFWHARTPARQKIAKYSVPAPEFKQEVRREILWKIQARGGGVARRTSDSVAAPNSASKD